MSESDEDTSRDSNNDQSLANILHIPAPTNGKKRECTDYNKESFRSITKLQVTQKTNCKKYREYLGQNYGIFLTTI